MTLRDYDMAIGALLRKEAITYITDENGARYTIATPIPQDPTITRTEYHVMSTLMKTRITYGEFINTFSKAHGMTENHIRYTLTTLRKKGYIDFGNRMYTRQVTLTDQGRTALGWGE